jgi:hypothetical protein
MPSAAGVACHARSPGLPSPPRHEHTTTHPPRAQVIWMPLQIMIRHGLQPAHTTSGMTSKATVSQSSITRHHLLPSYRRAREPVQGRRSLAHRSRGRCAWPPQSQQSRLLPTNAAEQMPGAQHPQLMHDRASRAAPIIRICMRRGRRCHTPLVAQSGGYARGPPPQVDHTLSSASGRGCPSASAPRSPFGAADWRVPASL